MEDMHTNNGMNPTVPVILCFQDKDTFASLIVDSDKETFVKGDELAGIISEQGKEYSVISIEKNGKELHNYLHGLVIAHPPLDFNTQKEYIVTNYNLANEVYQIKRVERYPEPSSHVIRLDVSKIEEEIERTLKKEFEKQYYSA